MKFMSCIKEKCESGDCKCTVDEESHFVKACMNMQKGCPDIGLECEGGEATCGGDSVYYSEDGEAAPSSENEEEQEQQKQQSASEEEEKEEDESASEEEAAAEERPSDHKELGSEMEGEDPEDELPAGWEKAWSEQEERYYYANRKTGESSWTKPKGYEMESVGDEEGGDASESSDEEEAPAASTATNSKYIKKGGKKVCRP
jgi:hypothetical protein